MLIVENGSGYVSAQCYVSVAYVDAYALQRKITSWTGATDLKEASIIVGCEYMENRFNARYRGLKAYVDETYAKATLTITANLAAPEKVTIGGTDFVFSQGVTAYDTMNNLITSINAGGVYSASFGLDLSIDVKAAMPGPEGALTTVTSSSASATWNSTTMLGGSIQPTEQGLSFPRQGLFTRSGTEVLGVPPGVKNANAEYAIRARAGVVLAPDPAVGDGGQLVTRTRKKIGPLEKETYYSGGFEFGIGIYPAADSLLKPFMGAGGGGVYV